MHSILNGRRLVIAHNPHSARSAAVQSLVFDRLDAAGYLYSTLEVQQASLADNVARLASQILAGDLILSAAGDGSAHAVAHSVMAANQSGVELGFLAFGNFNDVPHTFTDKATFRDPVAFLERAKPERVWPLSVHVDGKPLRNAILYVTAGWTARAANQFDDPTVRSRLTKGGAGVTKSVWRLTLYYFKTRRLGALPAFRYDGTLHQKKTDLIFANGPTVARLFRSGRRYYRQNVFLYRMLDIRRLITNMPFLASGVIGLMRGSELAEVAIEFEQPSLVPIQCDGEVVELQNVTRLEVRKADRPLSVLATK